MSKFLILALPRSGTAWLANLFTFGDVFCYHEGLSMCRSTAEFKDLMRCREGEKVIGNSDPANVLVFDKIDEVLGRPKLLFVRRSLLDVSKSLDAAQVSVPPPTLIGLDRKLTDLYALHRERSIQISFAEIFNFYYAAKAASFLFDRDLDEQRFKMLCDLQVQIHPAKMHDLINSRLEQFGQFLNQ